MFNKSAGGHGTKSHLTFGRKILMELLFMHHLFALCGLAWFVPFLWSCILHKSSLHKLSWRWFFRLEGSYPNPYLMQAWRVRNTEVQKGRVFLSGSGFSMSNQTCYTIITLSLGSWLMQCYSSVAGFTHALMHAIMWCFIIFIYIFVLFLLVFPFDDAYLSELLTGRAGRLFPFLVFYILFLM